jgi:hypothetical protein
MIRWLALALTLATVGVAACGDDDADGGGTTTAADATGETVLIKTRVGVPDAPNTPGPVELLAASRIGDSPFCAGGTIHEMHYEHGSPAGFIIERTFRCPAGTLKVGFSPTQPTRVVRMDWEVMNGTGEFEGATGGGRVVARFEKGEPPTPGQETFTGTVTR